MASIIDAVWTIEVLDVLNVLGTQLHTMRMEPVEEQLLHEFSLQADQMQHLSREAYVCFPPT